MDSLDVRVIREFLQGAPLLSGWSARPKVRPDLGQFSRNLGVTKNTIKERHRKLASFLSGWTLMLNPGLTGERWAVFAFDVSNVVQKSQVLERIGLIEDVLMTIDYLGSYVVVVFFYKDAEAARKKTELMKSLAGCEKGLLSDIPYPPCGIMPSTTDLQIIASRQKNMLKSDREVAIELGFSAKTAIRRYLNLVNNGAVWPIAHLSIEGLKEGVYATLTVSSPAELRGECETKIVSEIDEYLVFRSQFVSYSWFDMILPNLSVSKKILEKVSRVRGVSSVRIDLVEGRLEYYDVLSKKVQEQVTRTANSRPGSHLKTPYP